MAPGVVPLVLDVVVDLAAVLLSAQVVRLGVVPVGLVDGDNLVKDCLFKGFILGPYCQGCPSLKPLLTTLIEGNLPRSHKKSAEKGQLAHQDFAGQQTLRPIGDFESIL